MKRLPDPKPEARIVDGTAEPLDSGPIDENYCPCCHATTFEWHRHHVVGRGQGGDDVPENLVWLCSDCHWILHNHKPGTETHNLFVAYVRSLDEVLYGYVAQKKHVGWLEDRYLGVRL